VRIKTDEDLQDGIRPLVELTDLVLERARLEDLARYVSVVTPPGP
jgi:hypothetical protein